MSFYSEQIWTNIILYKLELRICAAWVNFCPGIFALILQTHASRKLTYSCWERQHLHTFKTNRSNSKSTFRSLKAGTRSYSPSDLYPTEDSLATNVKRKQLSEDVRICASAGKCWDKIRNILQGQSSAKEWLVSDAFFRDRRLQHTNRCHF